MFNKHINPWWNVFAGAICNFFTAGIVLLYAISFFTASISASHGFGREVLSFSFTCFFISLAFGWALLGYLIYRWGIKIPSVAGLVLFGAAVAVVPFLPSNPYLFYLTFCIIGLCGAAAGPVPASIAVTGWFDEKRGLALGVVAAGGGLGGAILPHYARFLLQYTDWRNALALIGLTASVIPIICLILWVRTPPGVTERTGESQSAQASKVEWKDYGKRIELWILAFTVLSLSIGTVGALANVVPLLADRGFTPQLAAQLMSVVGISTLVGRLATGVILDKVFGPYVAGTICLLCIVGLVLFLIGGTSMLPLMFAAVFVGVAAGAEADVVVFLVGRYFSLDTYSRVVGIMWSMVALGGAFGTYISGVVFNSTGSYVGTFVIFSVILLISSVLVLRLGPYTYPAKRDVTPAS